MKGIEEAVNLIEIGNVEQGLEAIDIVLPTCSDEEKFNIAENLHKYGFLEKAKKIIDELLIRYPEEDELLIFKAEILIEIGEEENAISLLDAIDQNSPEYIHALLLLADLYQMQGLYEVSEAKLLLAKKMIPSESIIDFGLAELYAAQGEFKKSIEFYKLVQDSEVLGISVNQRLAESLSASGLFEDALPFYEKALQDKFEINTLFGHGFTAYHAGYFKTAINKFTELKEIDPQYSSLYLFLAKAYEAEEDDTSALQIIEEGLKVDEYNKELYLKGGRVALKVGEIAKSEVFFREAIAIDPGYIEAIVTLTKLFLNEERYEDVVECLNEVMSYGEYDPQFEWDLALSKNKLELYSDALNHYNHAYTFFKDNIDFLQEYGYFLLEEGNREEAKKIFKHILKLDPSLIDIEEIVMQLEE